MTAARGKGGKKEIERVRKQDKKKERSKKKKIEKPNKCGSVINM